MQLKLPSIHHETFQPVMVKNDPEHTFIVDTRTRAEYQLIGHPVGAYNVPKKFWTGKRGEKKYGMESNPNYAKDLLDRFDPASDKLIFMCRSGKRSCLSCKAAIEAGWKPERVCNMLGGFKGDKIKCKDSANSAVGKTKVFPGPTTSTNNWFTRPISLNNEEERSSLVQWGSSIFPPS